MKKVLLAGTALLGLAVLATPAQADIDLKVGGYFAGYGVFTDNDEPAGQSLRDYNLRRDNELYFSGETTLDNGLTVGAHTEIQLGASDKSYNTKSDYVDETYAYFSGNWGRVNIGAEDGAAYLLQVEAPSADTNVDGLRQYISALTYGGTAPTGLAAGLPGGYNGAAVTGANPISATTLPTLDYDHADFRSVDRLTYLTPKFNGFQAGLSYAPEAFFNGTGGGTNPAQTDKDQHDFEDLLEVAARWDGAFSGFGISVGGGYSHASREVETVATEDALETWNAGLNLTFSAFSLGGAYLTSNNATDNQDSDTWVVGAAWDNGPYHVGVSYLDTTHENLAGGSDVDVQRITLGGGYTFGPGMTFRGSVAFGEVDAGPGNDIDFTQVAIGTDIQF